MENAGKHHCKVCNVEIKLLSAHMSQGIPKYCPKCRCKGSNHKWNKIRNEGCYLFSEAAKKLKIGTSTLQRHAKGMKIKKINGVRAFTKDDIKKLRDRLLKCNFYRKRQVLRKNKVE